MIRTPAILALAMMSFGCTERAAELVDASGPQKIEVEGALSQQETLAALNANMPSLVPCTQAAGGQYVLVLSWTVQPDGSTTKVEVSRSKGTLTPSLKECVTSAMKSWAFPKSKLGTRIEQVPVKVGVKG